MNKYARYRARKRGEDVPLQRPGKKPQDNRERFEKHVRRLASGCWIWIGYRHKFGYGKFRIWPERFDRDAHRAAWMLYVGPVPAGLSVLHRCSNPPCVRLDHLYVGTQKDNVRDMDAAGRAARPVLRGERNPSAKVRAVDVAEMRALRRSGVTISVLCSRFSLSYSHVKRILRGTNWR